MNIISTVMFAFELFIYLFNYLLINSSHSLPPRISQLPEHYPTPIQTLHAVLQRKKIAESSLIWNDTVYSIDEENGKLLFIFIFASIYNIQFKITSID